MTVDELDAMSAEAFVAALDGVFEHAPWVAAAAAGQRPFGSPAALHDALMQAVRRAPAAEQRAFLDGHPELAASNLPADLTDSSRAEQDGLAMHRAAGAEALPALNQAYRARFGFPFIVCVARHTAEDVVRTLRARLSQAQDAEQDVALDEIGHITRLRLFARLGVPVPAGHFSTHVLDQRQGGPAVGLAVTLCQEGREIGSAVTDADGRVGDLMPPGPLREGHYELHFAAGAYFASRSVPTFYDVIPVRFVLDRSDGRYHVPLLLSPFGYSTYRGS